MGQEPPTPVSSQVSGKPQRPPLPPPIPIEYHATIEKSLGSKPLSEPKPRMAPKK